MGYIRDTVFILRSEPFRESDTRLSMYGREYGKHVAIARGSRKLSAKHLGHLEPLTKVEVMIAEGIAFDKLAVARLYPPEGPMRDRLGVMTIGGMFVALVDQMTRPGVRDPSVFDLIEDVLNTLARLEHVPTRERARLLYAGASFRLLYCLGSGPELKTCMRCQNALEEPVYTHPSLGGFSCQTCSPALRQEGIVGSRLPLHGLKLLRILAKCSTAELIPLAIEVGLIQKMSQLIDAFFSHTPLWNGEKTSDRVTVYFEWEESLSQSLFKADKTRGDNQDIMNKLRIAISRFPVSEDIERNEMFIKKYIVCAAQHEADIVYFPETAWSGYETDISMLHWAFLKESLDRIKNLATQYKIYVVLGAHRKQPQIKNLLRLLIWYQKWDRF